MSEVPMPLNNADEIAEGGRTYYLVIDTDQFAGNFPDVLCAYVTGQAGAEDPSVDGANVASHVQGVAGEGLRWAADALALEADEHCAERAYAIAPTPGFNNDGRGNLFRDDEQADELYLDRRWDAFQSVAIRFNRKLTVAELHQLASRARAFDDFLTTEDAAALDLSVTRSTPGLSVIGVRYVEVMTVQTCLGAWEG